MEKKHLRKHFALYLCLVILNLAFIWGNSFVPGEISGEISGGIFEVVSDLFAVFGDKGQFVLRKLAHFSEYTALGFFLGGIFTAQGQKGIHRFTMPLLCGLFAACVDETIQIFAEARGSSLIDVWLDTSGVCFGLLVHEVLHRLRLKNQK